MAHELQLGYLVLEVPDPSTLDSFFGDVIGLAPGAPTPAGAQTWRNDHKASRLIVEAGPASDAVVVGLEATDATAFDSVTERLRSAGYEPADETAALGAERGVDRIAAIDAPWGGRVELVLGQRTADTPFSNPLVPGGWLTDGVGLGHMVLTTPHFDETHALLTEGLGFARSDWLQMEVAPGFELTVYFYHCNSRHHSIAIAKAPAEPPQRLHHIMFETVERDDVGAAFDRAWDSGLPIPNGLGRHDNDGMFSFYVAGPAGFQVEVGYGGRVVTDDWDDDRQYDRVSSWGHQPLRK